MHILDSLKASNVVLPNGSLDPWHALGITSTRRPSDPAVYIQGTSHCQNMGPSRHYDSAALKRARQKISAYIGTILGF